MIRPCCERCLRPLSTCLCALVRPVANQVDLLILQHPLEEHQAKGTARLLHLSLARSELRVGEVFEPAWLAPLLAGAVLLYPEDRPPGRRPPWPALPPRRPVVLDGTWRKSRKMLALNPGLLTLPRLSWETPPVSRYAVRRAERAGQLSTLEAASLALAQLEGRPAACYAPLQQAFEAWLARTAARQGSDAPPRRGAGGCAGR